MKVEPESELPDAGDEVEEGEEVEVPQNGPDIQVCHCLPTRDESNLEKIPETAPTIQRPAGPPLSFPPQAVLGSCKFGDILLQPSLTRP